MKFVGVDIRIVDIPKPRVVEVIREFIASNHLNIERDEQLDTAVTHIRTCNQIDSYLKLWWKGSPQVIDWRILDLDGREAQIEIRYGILWQYRAWLWGIAVSMIFLSYICAKVSLRSPVTVGIDEFRVAALFAVVLILLTFFLLLFIGRLDYRPHWNSVESFIEQLKRTNGTHYERTILSSHRFIDSHLFSFMLAIGYILMIAGQFEVSYFLEFPIIGTFSLTIIFILVVMLILAKLNRNLERRGEFLIVSIPVTVFLLVFYSLPYFNLFQGSPVLYRWYIQPRVQLEQTQAAISAEQYPENVKAAASIVFLLIGAFYMFLILIAIVSLAYAPGNVRHLKKFWNSMFSGNASISSYGEVADLRGYSRQFRYPVIAFWVLLSIAFYVLAYNILCILEFSLFAKNFVFHSERHLVFCAGIMAISTFIAQALLGRSIGAYFGRFLLLSYCIPFLWLVCKVARKRANTYLRKTKEFRTLKMTDNSNPTNLRKLVSDIAKDCGIVTPEIVMIGSQLPEIGVDYIGFPYFRFYIIVSKGCCSLREKELIGVLAHEIYHIKHHSFKWHAMNLLSDYTFFGNGFLTTITNSFQYEFAADYYATVWAKRKGAVSDFIKTLQVVSSRGRHGLNLIGEGYEIREKKSDLQVSFLNRLRENMDVFCEFYFGGKILSYIHPPMQERIKRIIAVAQGLGGTKE